VIGFTRAAPRFLPLSAEERSCPLAEVSSGGVALDFTGAPRRRFGSVLEPSRSHLASDLWS
jgi:hypothetical protein